MRVSIAGSGYVGLVSGAGLSDVGHHVVCMDIDEARVDGLKNGVVPIFEPGLEKMLRVNSSQGRLEFTSSIARAVEHAEVLFIAVGTPPDEDGSADLSHVLAVAAAVGEQLEKPLLVVVKSTVPVGTCAKVRDTITEKLNERGVEVEFSVASNPEFLKEAGRGHQAWFIGYAGVNKQVSALLHSWHREVIDADLSGYFDSIPHAELMKSVARRISDRHMLRLIKMWLQAPVEETDKRGRKRRTTRNKDMGRGTPQGAPISPLLSNLYMRRFILGWKVLGYERRFQAKIVNYADDLVICCRRNADQAMEAMRSIFRKLKLTVNDEKTHVCQIPDESFDFLGYTFGRCYTAKTGRAYVSERPSKRKIQAVCRRISEVTDRRLCWRDTEEQIAQLNRIMVGWANYFCQGPVGKPYRIVTRHARRRLRRWLCRKHKVQTGQAITRYPDKYLNRELGLAQLFLRHRNVPWATV